MGSIVWVRRRNGSWWPGKVLGPDELSSAHLMSPRSGTPVKLLGREDASVDWYNLEKSKRVKAFRCGEFDDCIEKAEASLGLPSKKREREKYARRDDAILHALRLEKEFLEKEFGNVGDNSISMKKSPSDCVVKDIATSGTLENGTGEHESPRLWPLHRKTGLSAGNGSSQFPSSSRKGRSVDLQGSHYSEVKPQMKDLQVLGMKTVVEPKLMASSSAAVNVSHEMMVGDEVRAFGSSSDADSENTSGRVKGLMYGHCGFNQEFRPNANWHPDNLQGIKKYAQVKRSRASYMPSESNYIAGLKGRRSGQMEIFGSHIQRGTHHPGHHGFTDQLPSVSSEDTESDSSETDSEEHATEAEMKTNSGTFTPMGSQSIPPDDASISSEDDEDSMSPDYTPQFHHHDPVSMDRMSRWQLKRKRNLRSSPRKSVDRLASTSYLNAGGRPLWRRTNDSASYYHDNNGFPSDVEFYDDVQVPMVREHGNNRGGYLPNPQSAIRSNEVFLGDNMETWMWRNRFSGGYWGGRNGGGGFGSFYATGRHMRNMLVDVELKVEAQHQRDVRVPWVSMTSGLNGNSIVGLPIQVEKLENGSTDFLLSTVNAGFGNFEFDYRRNKMAPPLWHDAGKRTAVNTALRRVPRPNILEEDDLYRDQDQRVEFNRIAVAGLPAQRNTSHLLSSKNKKKKVASKKSSSSPSLKIRPLTSIGIGQSFVSDDLRDDDDYSMDLGSSGPPTVACIPLKLVFSRLLEAVGKPPSVPAARLQQ